MGAERGNSAPAASRPLNDCGPDEFLFLLPRLVDELLDSEPAFRPRTRHLDIVVSADVDRASRDVPCPARPDWQEVRPAEAVAASTDLVVTIENDIKALTAAEHWFGEGIGTEHFALVTIGSGIGSGLVANGGLITGAYGAASRLGHIRVDPRGPRCRCGVKGCLDAFAGPRTPGSLRLR